MCTNNISNVPVINFLTKLWQSVPLRNGTFEFSLSISILKSVVQPSFLYKNSAKFYVELQLFIKNYIYLYFAFQLSTFPNYQKVISTPLMKHMSSFEWGCTPTTLQQSIDNFVLLSVENKI